MLFFFAIIFIKIEEKNYVQLELNLYNIILANNPLK